MAAPTDPVGIHGHRAEAVCEVRWRYGLHARPCSSLAKLASGYSSTITVQRLDHNSPILARSIFGLMMLAAERGVILVVSAIGRDATDAVEAIRGLFDRSFDMHDWSALDANGVSVNTVTGATYQVH